MKTRIRPASVEDLPRVVAMLSAAGLPVADLSPEHLAFVAVDDERVVGAIGFEACGHAGLLRSLVVAEDARTTGLGRQLVAALEAHARELGVDELWLLTVDADPYFAQLGYRIRGRQSAPTAIQETDEFSALCPGDAFMMCKAL